MLRVGDQQAMLELRPAGCAGLALVRMAAASCKPRLALGAWGGRYFAGDSARGPGDLGQLMGIELSFEDFYFCGGWVGGFLVRVGEGSR